MTWSSGRSLPAAGQRILRGKNHRYAVLRLQFGGHCGTYCRGDLALFRWGVGGYCRGLDHRRVASSRMIRCHWLLQKIQKIVSKYFGPLLLLLRDLGIIEPMLSMRAKRVDAISDARDCRSHDVDRVYVSKRRIQGLAPIFLGLGRRFSEFMKSFFCCLVCCPTSSKSL